MAIKNLEHSIKKAELKITQRDKKKKSKMRVSGASVKQLQKILLKIK